MHNLRLPLRLRRPITDSALQASWQAVAARRARPARGMWRLGLALALAGFLMFLGARHRSTASVPALPTAGTLASGPVHLQDGSALAARSAVLAEVLAIDDGSSFALGAGTRLEVLRNDGHRVDVRLDSGTLTLEIRPNGPRVWSVKARNTLVRVIGTKLTIEMLDRSVRVSVEHGRVSVASEALVDGGRSLGAGESVVVPSEGASPGTEATSPAITPSALPDVPEAVPVRQGPGPSASEWAVLAGAKNFDGAYRVLGKPGLSREVARTEDVATLLALADVARLSHHPDAAVAPLERILVLAPRHPSAPLTAFTLGKIEVDELNRPSRGAMFFARCIELGAPRSLEEAVYMRWADALARSGDAKGAAAVAARYRAKYPNGQHLDAMSRWPAGD